MAHVPHQPRDFQPTGKSNFQSATKLAHMSQQDGKEIGAPTHITKIEMENGKHEPRCLKSGDWVQTKKTHQNTL